MPVLLHASYLYSMLTEKIIERTTRHTGHFASKTVLEVGPGPGSLTRSILNAGCKNLIVRLLLHLMIQLLQFQFRVF